MLLSLAKGIVQAGDRSKKIDEEVRVRGFMAVKLMYLSIQNITREDKD